VAPPWPRRRIRAYYDEPIDNCFSSGGADNRFWRNHSHCCRTTRLQTRRSVFRSVKRSPFLLKVKVKIYGHTKVCSIGGDQAISLSGVFIQFSLNISRRGFYDVLPITGELRIINKRFEFIFFHG